MPKITVVDPHHWIDPEFGFPEAGPVRAKAVRVAQCIEYGGTLARHEARNTLIACRFRPGGAPCLGFLIVIKQPDDTILAMCNTCEEEEFLIHNWQDISFADGNLKACALICLMTNPGNRPPFRPGLRLATRATSTSVWRRLARPWDGKFLRPNCGKLSAPARCLPMCFVTCRPACRRRPMHRQCPNFCRRLWMRGTTQLGPILMA